jgi:hypothetical protein
MDQDTVTRMHGYIDQYLSPDMKGQILVEKWGQVIVAIGDELSVTKTKLASAEFLLAKNAARLAKTNKTLKGFKSKKPMKVQKPLTEVAAVKILGINVEESVEVKN